MEKRQLLLRELRKRLWKKLEMKDDEVVKTVKEIKKARVRILRNNKWQIEDKLVLKKKKVYVLKNKELRLFGYIMI